MSFTLEDWIDFGCADAKFRTPFFFVVCGLLAIGLASGCGNDTAPADRAIEQIAFATSDGYELTGNVRRGPAKNPPGLILIHMLGSDRSAWSHFAERAAQEGYLSLAYDIRGHGDSRVQVEDELSFRSFGTKEWRGALTDIVAAKEALLVAGADPDNIVLVGASIGANLSLIYAASDPQIQAVVMLSPGRTYHGLESEGVMQEFRSRPTLIVATEGDSYSASSSAALKAVAPGFCELRMYAGSAHGTDILAAVGKSEGAIFHWLEGILREEVADGSH